MPVKIVNVRTWKGNGTYIGRAKDPKFAIFGNPFSHLDDTLAQYRVATVEEAIERYREWAIDRYETDEAFRLGVNSLVRRHVMGETVVLACFCKTDENPDAPCHGDVLKAMIETLAALGSPDVDKYPCDDDDQAS